MTSTYRLLRTGFAAALIVVLAGLLTACGSAAPLAQPIPSVTPEATLEASPTVAPVETLQTPPPDVSDIGGGDDLLPVPTQMPAAPQTTPTARPTVSALQRIRDEGQLRIGVLYNAGAMSRLDDRGEVVGYQADLARAIAADWEVEAVFSQVTRQTAILSLLSGEVDVLLASVVHRREDEGLVGFSDAYFMSGQMFLLRSDSSVETIDQINGLRVGVVQGTESERALGRATTSGRLNVTPSFYLTLDQAIGALGSGEIDALLATRVQLLDVADQSEAVRLLDEMLEPEPYAVAYRQEDTALGYLLDRSLQRIYASGRFAEIRRANFPNVQFALELPVWDGLDEDTRVLADFDTTLNYPEASLVDRIQAGEGLRVAGMDLSEQAGAYTQRMEAFYRAVITEMTRRWGVSVEFAPDTAANAIDLVASGQVPLAIGVTPDWRAPYEVAFSLPIVRHGDRMMFPVNEDITGFTDLRGGQWVGIFASEPGTADQVNELAESVNTLINVFTIINDEDAVYSMLVDGNADVVFGDSLRLMPLLAVNADTVTLTDRWYTTEYITLALPRADVDFRALVDITLQDMAQDGTFQRIWDETLGFDEPFPIEVWPGAYGQFAGIRTGAVQ